MIRNILGGFLFAGDDIYKRAGVLSGGERTRLAVARMLLRPANTLLLDEPTNHLDLDSKDVLLEALADFGGTLIFVSHDRYFVDRLATKVVAVGHGRHRGLSRDLRAVPVEPDAARRQQASGSSRPPRSASAPGSRRPLPRRSQGSVEEPRARRKPAGRSRLRPTKRRRRPTPTPAATPEGRRRPQPPDRRSGRPDYRAGTGDQGPRGPNGGPRVLRQAGASPRHSCRSTTG